jgi:MSHA biogenesis protein MshN
MVPLRSEEKAELAYQTGYDEIAQHNDRRAEQQFRQALALEPGHTRAREMLAGVLIKQGRWVETAELLQQGVQATPTHVVFIKLYARALMQLNRDQQAITLLREHAPPIAQDLEHHALLAALYQRQQNHLAAANIYSEILKQQPDAGIWWVGLGISLEAMGKQKQAQQAYTRARQTGALHGDIARYTDNRLLALDSIRYPVD